MDTYYKLTKQDLSQIIFAFVFKDDHPSETKQVEFAKRFDSFFNINAFRFHSVKEVEERERRKDKLVCYDILMDHFDSLPDDVKEDVHKRLNKIGL